MFQVAWPKMAMLSNSVWKLAVADGSWIVEAPSTHGNRTSWATLSPASVTSRELIGARVESRQIRSNRVKLRSDLTL